MDALGDIGAVEYIVIGLVTARTRSRVWLRKLLEISAVILMLPAVFEMNSFMEHVLASIALIELNEIFFSVMLNRNFCDSFTYPVQKAAL